MSYKGLDPSDINNFIGFDASRSYLWAFELRNGDTVDITVFAPGFLPRIVLKERIQSAHLNAFAL